MISCNSINHSADAPRDTALSSAIVMRDCSLRMQTSHAMRRACRMLMREQAFKWRQAAHVENPATKHG